MGGVGGVLHDAVGFAGASCKENVQDGWERGTDDLCSRVHCPLEGFAVSSTAVPVHLHFTFTFSHLADAFIQSDLQLGNT